MDTSCYPFDLESRARVLGMGFAMEDQINKGHCVRRYRVWYPRRVNGNSEWMFECETESQLKIFIEEWETRHGSPRTVSDPYIPERDKNEINQTTRNAHFSLRGQDG